MELIRYLGEHFFTREQLLAICAIDEAVLERWQAQRMMPLASYRLRLDVACDSFFGAHREQHAVDYYAKGYAAWAGVLQTLDSEAHALAVFARRYRERLARLAALGVAPRDHALATDEHIASEWNHFVDGTYGLCTVSGLPEDIAAKEAAIAVIREVDHASGRALDAAERARLRQAVDLLDSASSPFAPHEVARSSRRRYVDDMRRAHAL